ncbi:MAG: phosphate ABC transporter ATP-binding protein, partial [Asticcacaulis sp.]|nr:phosphate ABC transporter ATP-binding protein [Asticcacaulis sp.]
MSTDTTSPDFKSVITPPPADSLVLEARGVNF